MILSYFPKGEYDNRHKRARELMTKEGIDALFVCSEENVTYLSGARNLKPWFSFARSMFTILPADGDIKLIVSTVIADSVKEESWVKDIKTFPTYPLGAPVDLITETFKELGVEKGVIGAELGYEQRLGMTYLDFERIKGAASNAKFVDASNLLWDLRMVKSKAEIDYMKKACEITGKAYQTCFEEARIGMSEWEVYSILTSAMMKYGADSPGLPLMNSSPENYHCLTGGPTDIKLKRGNTLWIDSGARYRGYWADYSRIAAIGAPSEKQVKMHKLIVDVTRKIIEGAKPGIKACDLAEICNKEFKKAGVAKGEAAGRIGHGLGMLGGEPPHLAPYDKTVLKPGMVLTPEPELLTEYGNFHVEEDIVITEDGCEVISQFTPELQVIK